MPVALDCETGGLAPTDPVHVVSLYDSRSGKASSFVSSGKCEAHLIRAIDACEMCDQLVTFNGTAFDFRLIAHHVQQRDARRACMLAIRSYDVLLDFAVCNGYRSSLESFATATLNESKSMDGATAVAMWDAGEHTKVREYCEHDAAITCKLFEHGKRWGRLWRHTAKGRRVVWALRPGGMRTAAAAIADWTRAPADQSWMDDPPRVADAADWTLDYL